MAELRHSSSAGSRSSSSPLRVGDEDSSSPHVHDHSPNGGDDEDGRPRHRPIWSVSGFHSLFPFLGDDLRVSPQKNKISLLLILILAVASLISVYGIVNHLVSLFLSIYGIEIIRAFWYMFKLLNRFGIVNTFSLCLLQNAPYLCKKDGIVLNCPHVSVSNFGLYFVKGVRVFVSFCR